MFFFQTLPTGNIEVIVERISQISKMSKNTSKYPNGECSNIVSRRFFSTEAKKEFALNTAITTDEYTKIGKLVHLKKKTSRDSGALRTARSQIISIQLTISRIANQHRFIVGWLKGQAAPD